MRSFNKGQRQILFMQSGGLCSLCGIPLSKSWHGDHVLPWSLTKDTSIENGQALCPDCNYKKSNKIMRKIELRDWQKEFYKEPYEYFQSLKSHYLLHAGVGSGKTIAAILASKEFRGFNILICAPSENVKTEWAKEFHRQGVDINYKYKFTEDFRREYSGVSITYQALGFSSGGRFVNVDFLVKSGIVDKKTLIILDEVHHLGDNKSWGDSVSLLGANAGFVLSLTGTPYRSDNNRIPFATYLDHLDHGYYKLKVNRSYGYGQSVKDKICCPASFRPINLVTSEGLNEEIQDTADGRSVLNAALDVDSNTWVFDSWKKADDKLSLIREIMPEAGGLIVCNTIQNAKTLARSIPGSVVVTSDEDCADVVDKFSKSTSRWIISVRMVSEGVNIPRLRVILFATNITTMLYFQQVVGRAVRNRNDGKMGTIDHCFIFFPNYAPLVKNAKEIEDEIGHIVSDQEEELEKVFEDDFNDIQLDLFENQFIEVNAGDVGLINAGQDFGEWQGVLDKIDSFGDVITFKVRMEVERKIGETLAVSRAMNGAAAIGTAADTMEAAPLKADKATEIRRLIKGRVAVLSRLTDRKYGEIYASYNHCAGIKSTTTEHNTEKLMYMLGLLKNEIATVKEILKDRENGK